ncbi:uncharacterized protein LTR77_007554 [Saxophila tyrrhenica]|uniref:Flavoprotein domain-containing protein n=1 Tax=Saxophila tyrrhenica TaxID=1690608 RepID=A0AAV9P575_9PEZI|nr:hypothetical protein LTR77_007554 [Saxophila tyrrhenica]
MASPKRASARTTPQPSQTGLDLERRRDLHVLFASVGCADQKIIQDVLPKIAEIDDVSLKAILDPTYRSQDFIAASSYCLTTSNISRSTAVTYTEEVEKEAAELCEWADILVLAPIDANNLAKMLHGHTDNLLLEILRSWNVSKKVLLVPGMSALMWENPMTKKQLTKIRRKWNWVQVLQPMLWKFVDDEKKMKSHDATEELVDAVRNQVDLMNIGQDMEVSPTQRPSLATSGKKTDNTLPPELWTMIFDFTGDWELAQTMHVYTNLPPPSDWSVHVNSNVQGPQHYMKRLELTILRGSVEDVEKFIAAESVPRWLSKLCIRLIMRFAMTPLLSYLETNHRLLFWNTFGQTFLPDKASSVFGRTEILEFWRTSPSFLSKEYTIEALDGASRAGFVNVLEWWQHSGLPYKYTEASLEQASSQGHVSVLEWWKNQTTTADDNKSNLRLKPGKSICYATQNGHTDVVRWWLQSGIAFPHEDTVAKLASTHGHVDILQVWHELKGSKIIFDNQVLVGATKSGNVDVLEWWKTSGLKVEYKTCDIEEALEDGDEGERGVEVRRWWARNGLNLGVGTTYGLLSASTTSSQDENADAEAVEQTRELET